MKPITYTCAAPRDTPAKTVELMRDVAELLGQHGLTLRTGGDGDADIAAEEGACRAQGRAEVYLPWRDFNKHPSTLFMVSAGAKALVTAVHPTPEKLSPGALRLLGRRAHELMGAHLNSPSAMLLTWTRGGDNNAGDGLGLMLQLAELADIPVLNLGEPKYASGWAAKRIAGEAVKIINP